MRSLPPPEHEPPNVAGDEWLQIEDPALSCFPAGFFDMEPSYHEWVIPNEQQDCQSYSGDQQASLPCVAPEPIKEQFFETQDIPAPSSYEQPYDAAIPLETSKQIYELPTFCYEKSNDLVIPSEAFEQRDELLNCYNARDESHRADDPALLDVIANWVDTDHEEMGDLEALRFSISGNNSTPPSAIESPHSGHLQENSNLDQSQHTTVPQTENGDSPLLAESFQQGMDIAIIPSARSIKTNGSDSSLNPQQVQLTPPRSTNSAVNSMIKSHSSSELEQSLHNTPQKTLKRRRAYKDHELEKVNSVRESSACIRCQLMREPCSEDTNDGLCERCKAVKGSSRIWRLPCYRGRLSPKELEIFRTGSLRFPQGMRKITAWDGNEKRTLQLFFNLTDRAGNEPAPLLNIVCRKFRPLNGDVLTKNYPTPRGTVVLQLPHFVVSSVPAAARAMELFVENNFQYFLKELTIGDVGDLFSDTFHEAIRLSAKSTLLKETLKIAIITRLASKTFGICGPESLGIDVVSDPDSPYVGKRPIPPMLDGQMDLQWMAFMTKKKKGVITELKKRIFRHHRDDWLETFLCLFVLLHNLEFCCRHQCMKLRRKIAAESSQPVFSFHTASMLDKWEMSANNLLAHFTIICQGSLPFTLDWMGKDVHKAAGLDEESIEYMMKMVNILDRQRVAFKLMEIEFKADPESAREKPFYWISKLFPAPRKPC